MIGFILITGYSNFQVSNIFNKIPPRPFERRVCVITVTKAFLVFTSDRNYFSNFEEKKIESRLGIYYVRIELLTKKRVELCPRYM